MTPGRQKVTMLNLQEAIDIEKRAHMQDLERRQKAEEKRSRIGMPRSDEMQSMTKEERERRIWAFMTHKATESDLEEDDYDEDDEDPSLWYVFVVYCCG